MCQKESWGAIFATTEAHSTPRDQPPRISFRGIRFKKYKRHKIAAYRLNGIPAALFSGVGNILHPYAIQCIVNRRYNDSCSFVVQLMGQGHFRWDMSS